MKKPVLVIMAAGMGSRYGGLKQIDPVDPEGHIIMDFSLYDAKKAGFEEVIFIIKKENEKDFKETIGDRISKIMKVSYVFQDLKNLPEGYSVPEGSTVSMNMWGFSASLLKELKDRFPAFLDEAMKTNPLKGEYFLPSVVSELLAEDKADVKVLKSLDKWYGVTYKEDKPVVVNAICKLKAEGKYPEKLWEE